MRTDVHHLPQVQQDELARVVRILMEEFENYTSRGTETWRTDGKIYKIILFGSYARDDWVDEPETGYQSDFDLLIVVSNEKLTEISEFWYLAEDRMLRDSAIGRPVNILVHALHEVNEALSHGKYFWVDIVRDGIALYELPGHGFAPPMPVSAKDALRLSERWFADWMPKIDRSLTTAMDQLARGADDLGWRKEAAFSLHQATERAYICYLLVRTHYFPRSHNIKRLRLLAEDKEPRLSEAWPRETKGKRRLFEALKRAYVQARYSPHYEISSEELETISMRVRRLRDLVEEACRDRIEELRKAAL